MCGSISRTQWDLSGWKYVFYNLKLLFGLLHRLSEYLTTCEFDRLKCTKALVSSFEEFWIDIVGKSQCVNLMLCPIVGLPRSTLVLLQSHKAEAYSQEITWTAVQGFFNRDATKVERNSKQHHISCCSFDISLQ